MYDHKNGVSFKKLAKQDLHRLRKLKEDSWTTTHRVAFVNDQDQDEWFNSIPGNALHMICYRTVVARSEVFDHETNRLKEHPRETEAPIGLLSITNIDWISRTAQIGGSIFKADRGTEWSQKAWEGGTDFAFEMLNLHRIDGEVLENNIAALVMDVKLGYAIEGKRRKAVYKSGVYLDSYVVGCLREEWEASALKRYGGCCNRNFKLRTPSEEVLARVGVHLPPEIADKASIILGSTKIDLKGPKPEDVEKYHQAVS